MHHSQFLRRRDVIHVVRNPVALHPKVVKPVPQLGLLDRIDLVMQAPLRGWDESLRGKFGEKPPAEKRHDAPIAVVLCDVVHRDRSLPARVVLAAGENALLHVPPLSGCELGGATFLVRVRPRIFRYNTVKTLTPPILFISIETHAKGRSEGAAEGECRNP